MPSMTSQRFLGHPAKPKRQRTRFPTPIVSKGVIRARGGKYIGWWDYSNTTGERIQTIYTDQKSLPANMRVSTAGSVGGSPVAYVYFSAASDFGDTERFVQMARTSTAMTLFVSADETQLTGVNGNGHAALRVPASLVTAGATWGVNAPFGAMSMYSTPSSVTIFGGDIESNVAAKSAVGINIRGFELRLDVGTPGVELDYAGNFVCVP